MVSLEYESGSHLPPLPEPAGPPRIPRVGVVDHLLSVAYIYPFRCGHCLRRFRATQWGKRYRRRVPARL